MLRLHRAAARSFRALAGKCVPGRGRGPAPPVTLRQANGKFTLSAEFGDVGLCWASPAVDGSETLVVPMALLDAVDGPGNDTVEIERDGTDRFVARWTDRGVPRSFPGDLVAVDSTDDPGPSPDADSVVGSEFPH